MGDAERESSRLVEGVARRCGLLRPSIALEWVAELEVMRPPGRADEHGAPLAAAPARRAAVVAELAHGVSADMLLRSHAQGPNKQEAHGARARGMVQRLRRLDSRSLVRAAIFDLLFASGDRHLEHVLMREDGGMTLIDNAHTILTSRRNTRHTPNSLFIPGHNFFARNRVGFPFLHCCSTRGACPRPRSTCPGKHTLYWPALMLDYRCHAPGGRLGHALPPRTTACLAQLAAAGPANVSATLGVPAHSRKLRRLLARARRLLERGFEGVLRTTDHSPGYYREGRLHNGEGVPPPCCAITLDAPTGNRQDDEWRCHAQAPEPLVAHQWADDGSLARAAVASSGKATPDEGSQLPRAGAGVVPSSFLGGLLHTASLSHRLVPTNASLTPQHLRHELGRTGDWVEPSRVDSTFGRAFKTVSGHDAAEGVEGEAVVAVAAGSGLWAAISSAGSLLVCTHPCPELTRLESPSRSRLAAATVGNHSLFVVTKAGEAFGAAADARLAGGGRRVRSASVPRLGMLRSLTGSLTGRRVSQVVASSTAAAALDSEGGLHAWGLVPDERCAGPRRAECSGGGTLALSPRPLPVPLENGPGAGVSLSDTHLLLLTRTAQTLSIAWPREHTDASHHHEASGLGRCVGENCTGPHRFGLVEQHGLGFTMVAAGSAFSLAIVGAGPESGHLMYWGGAPKEAAAVRHRDSRPLTRLPSSRPSPLAAWSRERAHRALRFLLVAAHGLRAAALTEAGRVLFWTHGATAPELLEPTSPSAVSALAVGDTLALMVVPTFDVRGSRRDGGPADRQQPLLVPPAPLARPLLTRSDNIGVREAVAARPEAFAAARDGFDPGVRAATCWSTGRRGAECPLRRKADCDDWRGYAERQVMPGDDETTRCLPAALVLAPRGCAHAAQLGRMIESHPDVVGAPASLRPWWAYRAVSNLTERPLMRAAARRALERPGSRLLVQRSLLDARSVGLDASLRRAGVGLHDLLPRVQPGLKVLVVLCEPFERLRTLTRAASAAARVGSEPRSLREELAEFERCTARAPAAHCAAARANAPPAPLVEGAYSLWLRELMRALPATQIRVLRGEDAAREPSRALGEVLEFFRLPPMPGDGVRTAPPARRSPDGQSGEWRRGGSLEKEVSWFYEDYAAELVQLVGGDPRFAWADDWK